MTALHATITGARLLTLAACLVLLRTGALAQSAVEHIELVEAVNEVQLSSPRDPRWISVRAPQVLRPHDRLRTGPNSRAALRWTNNVVPVGANTELEILPPQSQRSGSGLFLLKGILSFFHRDQPGRIRVITRGAVAGIDGTEFVVSVDDAGTTTVSVIDGIVSLSNEFDRITLTNGEQAVASPVAPPRRTAGFVANNVLQWVFYYPAILDVSELGLTLQETNAFGESLAAYQAGDLPQALATAVDKAAVTEAARVYKAALMLSVGEVAPAEVLLDSIQGGEARTSRHALALRQLIAAVKAQRFTNAAPPEFSSELLAASYYEQSLASGDDALRRALDYARRAAGLAPHSGFAWVRVAELEFSFGRTAAAAEALDRALSLAPRNAQAHALKGYLLAAQNRTSDAIRAFENALAIDSALGNAWLGRGLCRIRKGDRKGREDILVAAALEPRRAQVRSYLGKAFHDAGETTQAMHELDLARSFDANDPTPPLYSALIKADQNRINEAIADLEESQELNDNRGIYRSRLMLDQDRGVRSANLARIYRDAGLIEWSLQEASRAVSYDYANYSAHLFLANSYDALRDPRRVNLRYETPAESEFLIANLLAPAAAGIFSPAISQQEYTRFFERNRLGLLSLTEYRTSGDWLQSGAHYGVLDRLSYSLEASYRSDGGQRPNNDFEERVLTARAKQQITAQDSIYLQTTWYEASGGDLAQYYDQANANREFRTRENQDPTISLGFHHQWNPGTHTLALVSRLSDRFSVQNAFQPTFFVSRTNGDLRLVSPMTANQRYRSDLEIISAEVQQILTHSHFTTTLGVRWQGGEITTENVQNHPYGIPAEYRPFFDPDRPAARQKIESDIDRVSAYAYEQWRLAEPLLIVGGITYDYSAFPRNFRAAPISEGEQTVSRLSPKTGVIWTPTERTALRAFYSRSLGGVALEQSTRLEPTHVAGFNQSYRSFLPESVAGASAAERFQVFGGALEHKLPTRTYLTLAAQQMNSQLNRAWGVFEVNEAGFATIGTTRESLDFEERSLALSVNQLVGNCWAFGVRYRVTDAEVESRFPQVLPTAILRNQFRAKEKLGALLHEVGFHATFNHRSGVFLEAQALWYGQDNDGYSQPRENEDLWQCHVFAGYRFWRRKAEISVGLVNITDDNYKLNPLTLYSELPRERTFVTRLKLDF